MGDGVTANDMAACVEVAEVGDAQETVGADTAGGDEEMASPTAFLQDACGHAATADAAIIEGEEEQGTTVFRGGCVRAWR
jgi:hypothetical protein